MNRRGFLGALVAATATVAVGARLATAMPRYEYRVYGTERFYGVGIPELLAEDQKKISAQYTKALAQSMTQTKEIFASNVLSTAFA